MKTLLLIVTILSATTMSVLAQETPKFELFGGYSYMRLAQNNNLGDQDTNGFNSSFTNYFSPYVGITGEFSGNFGDARSFATGSAITQNLNTYVLSVGPRLAYRGMSRITPFGHTLVGIARQNINNDGNPVIIGGVSTGSQSIDSSGLALTFGGGVDLNITPNFALRAAQADYILTRINQPGLNQPNQNNVRISTGLVYRFGGTK